VRTLLVLGGYGTFGGRIALRAAESGFRVLVAGRNAARAQAFCARHAALVPLTVDRDSGLERVLEAHRPFAVVDAAGPFQHADYRIAEAAIAAGAHYLDIADARDFVAGISKLDARARAAGVCVIAGASSLPALSGAIARHLAEGLDAVRAVEIVLSASSRGTAGRSVVAAILSYLGRPIPLWCGRRWITRSGWQGLRRQRFAVPGVRPLRGRLVARADVPDLTLLPGRLPGAPSVTFFAGTDIGLHNLGLWLLSWPVRWGWLREAGKAASWLVRLHRWTRWASSLRSAFEVRLWGHSGCERVERRWTLIAENGDGPEIPTLAASLLLSRLASLPPGARDAGESLTLADFDAAFAGLDLHFAAAERRLPPPLYARVMGDDFDALAPTVRRLHAVLRDDGASGRAQVRRGRNLLARLVARLFRFPPEGEHDLHVSLCERDGRERWTRDFGGRLFSSGMEARSGLLVERFGPFRFGFDLPSDGAGGLAMVMRRWWMGPVPLPMILAPRAPAREWQEDGRFHLDVSIGLPLVGPVVQYRGWLAVEEITVPVAAHAGERARA
jgi:hypothetical protein